MSLAFCLSFSLSSHLPRSLSSSGLKPSFFGMATVWQYWQFLAGMPAAFACDSIWGVAHTGAAASSESTAPDITDTAATITRLESVMGRPPSRSAWLETLQQGDEIGHLLGLYCRPRHPPLRRPRPAAPP